MQEIQIVGGESPTILNLQLEEHTYLDPKIKFQCRLKYNVWKQC